MHFNQVKELKFHPFYQSMLGKINYFKMSHEYLNILFPPDVNELLSLSFFKNFKIEKP
jgi:hypothetical protein